jgi:acyl-CoA reductase-like NAD-dependent aldehyde dehydrogenase
MKRSIVAVASIALLVASISVASAQGGGRGQGRGFGGLGLLNMEAVQAELKMTQPQKDKLATKGPEIQQAMQEAMQGFDFQNATPEERQKFIAKTQEIQSKAVVDLLDSTQMKRYKQLELQFALQNGGGFGGGRGGGGGGARPGGAALGVFGRKDVAEELKLTDAQKADIEKIQGDVGQARRDAFQNLQGASPEERQAAMAKIGDLQKGATTKILALLTADQKAKWSALTGAPFTFPSFAAGRRPNPPSR